MNHRINSCARTSHFLGCLIGTALLVSATSGQHNDIAVYQNGGRVTLHNSSVTSQPEQRVYRNDFSFWNNPAIPGIYVGDNPGIQMTSTSAPAGYESLPGSEQLLTSLVPVHIPGQALGNVLFWDGLGGTPQSGSIPAGHRFLMEDAASNDFELLSTTARIDGLIAGVTNSGGGVHQHMNYALENGGNPPAEGFYLLGWQLALDQLEDSLVSFVTLNSPTFSSAVKTDLVDWLESQNGLITMAGDFDDNGHYQTDDIDALVAAAASGLNDERYDLTLDGIVNLNDVDAWRALAGAVLNESGAPILPGDSDLNGDVNGQDFVAWNNSKFTNSGTWQQGDFNADGVTNGQDFVIWNNNKFLSANDQILTVPEPRFGWLCHLGLVAWLMLQRSFINK